LSKFSKVFSPLSSI